MLDILIATQLALTPADKDWLCEQRAIDLGGSVYTYNPCWVKVGNVVIDENGNAVQSKAKPTKAEKVAPALLAQAEPRAIDKNGNPYPRVECTQIIVNGIPVLVCRHF